MLLRAIRKLGGTRQQLRPWAEQQYTWKASSQRYLGCPQGWQALPYRLTLCSIRVSVPLTPELYCMQAASQLYMDAIDILADQEEGKEGLSGDLFRQAIG